ncbi:hypothetical protein BBO_02061 [Beauveria brongniartii RCEF 3172]|uniref:Uncharacterized protein n=1 Tax=Beauveria brongniartii RCEF 3172 TaxID=1081107 RepID=A0A167IFD1_9HYPO|nr:hypothetical protein BBO_02061 [Beauveria brongniartii RCEF 3172]
MAPAEINLSQTRRWLAQLHTTNLPPVPAPSSSSSSSSTSSFSSTHSRGSVDYTSSASSCTICSSAGCGGGGGTCTSSPTTTTTASSSPLTETRARSLQRLCALSDAHRAAEDEVAAAAAAADAPSGNERFTPSNINYIRATRGSGGQGSKMDAQPMGWSRWARRQSVQSLRAVERDAAPRFSLSKLKSWW